MKKTIKKEVPFSVPTKDVDAIMKKIGAKNALVIFSNGDTTAVAKLWGKDDKSTIELIQAIQSVLMVVKAQTLFGNVKVSANKKKPVSKSQSRRVAVQKKAVKKVPANRKRTR